MERFQDIIHKGSNSSKAQKKKERYSSLSFGQASLSVFLPKATSCAFYLMILLEKTWLDPCPLDK